MYVKVENGKPVRYPYTIEDLRRDNPKIGFPDSLPKATLSRFGLYKVIREPQPRYNSLTQTVVQRNMPNKKLYKSVDREGNERWLPGRDWVLEWDIVNIPENQASKNVRQRRDQLLLESDWTQANDAPVDQKAWSNYRQALRDVPQQSGFPYNVTWPEKPL